MKVLYISDVLGLIKLHYYMYKSNKSLHDEYMKELLENKYLEDITEVFDNERDFIRNNAGFIENENKIYAFSSNFSKESKRLRTEKKGQEIIEKYNKLSQMKLKIQYKEIEEKDFERVVIVEWDDGSESILFEN